MIFPQLRQFGAGVKRGCIEALQLHVCRFFADVGLVETSSAAIAAVRSAIFVVMMTDPFAGLDDPEPAGREDLAGFDFTFGK
jgi:hypothetical protein